jgi:hypothetical protein
MSPGLNWLMDCIISSNVGNSAINKAIIKRLRRKIGLRKYISSNKVKVKKSATNNSTNGTIKKPALIFCGLVLNKKSINNRYKMAKIMALLSFFGSIMALFNVFLQNKIRHS